MNTELPPQRVAIVGPGRAGTNVALALARAGHRVVAVGGGSDESRARFMAQLAGTRGAADPAEAVEDATLVVVAVPDDAIVEVVGSLAAANCLREGTRVVHLSGVSGLEVLRRATLAGCMTAALHPAQTLTLDPPHPERLVGAAWAVTARERDRGWAHELVVSMGGDPHDVGDDVRVLYHAALVVGSNAAGAAVAMARQLLLAARVDDPAAFLGPLVAASTQNTMSAGAAAVTGPVVRGDLGTIAAHLESITVDLPHLAAAYRDFQRAIADVVAPSLDERQREALRAALADPPTPVQP